MPVKTRISAPTNGALLKFLNIYIAMTDILVIPAEAGIQGLLGKLPPERNCTPAPGLKSSGTSFAGLTSESLGNIEQPPRPDTGSTALL